MALLSGTPECCAASVAGMPMGASCRSNSLGHRRTAASRWCWSLTPSPFPCLWTELEYTAPHHAQEALAGREGCVLSAVGLWPGEPPAHSVGSGAIATWAAARGVEAVVWTALEPKFNKVPGQVPESADAAIAYLRQLDAKSQARAREYVERAPAQVKTAFRRAFEQELGWAPSVGA